MATTKAKAKEAVVTEAPVATESTYTIAELVENYKVFNTYREIVDVALRLSGKKTATVAEAKKIIDNFKTKEVK